MRAKKAVVFTLLSHTPGEETPAGDNLEVVNTLGTCVHMQQKAREHTLSYTWTCTHVHTHSCAHTHNLKMPTALA